MNSVGALKSVMGVVGSNILNSAKDATKHVVDKIKGKTIHKVRRIHNKKRKAGNEKHEIVVTSDDVNDKSNLINSKLNEDNSLDSDSSFDCSDSDENSYSSENDSILDFRDRVVSEQEYNKLTELLSRDIKVTNRGNSEMEKQIWLTPRRFRTTIRSVQIENLTKVQQNNVFLEFSFGGTLTEIRLLDGKSNKEIPRLLGYPPCKEFYTHSVDIKPFLLQETDDLLIDIPNNMSVDNDTDDNCIYDGMRSSNSVDISVDETFEWRGSYLHLERELFRIMAWRSKISTVNEMLGYSEDVLKNYATGSVNQMITLSKRTQNNISIPMFRISLQIIFQEIYDFQLNLTQFTLRNSNDKKDSEIDEINNSYEFGNEINYGTNNKNELSPSNRNTENMIKIDLTDKSESQNLIPISDKASYRLNIKFPQYGQDSPFPTKCTSDWSCNDSGKDKIVRWNNIGVIPFRGTIHELEKNNLYVKLDINSNSSKVNIFGAKEHINYIKLPDGETYKLEGKMEFGSIPKYHQLGNILEIDDENKLYMIIKIVKIDNLISNVYEISNILQENDDSIDVFVQLTFDGTRKETPVVSGSIHPLFHTEITFIIENIDVDKLDKEFNEDKLIKLLERKGPITIDVWRKNSKTSMVSHIGWCEIHWRDILIRTNSRQNNILLSPTKSDINSIGLSPLKLDMNMSIKSGSSNNNNNNNSNSGNSNNNLTHYIRRREYRKFYDRNIGKEIIYETRIYQNGNVLYNFGDRPGLLLNSNSNLVGNNQRNSLNLLVSPRIYLEIWTKPDIIGLYNVKLIGNENKEVTKNLLNKLNKIVEWSGIGPSLRQTRIRSNVYYWENVTKSFETWGRRYSYFGIDSRGIRHLLPTFIQPLKPLVGIDNSAKVHHFVHSFPYSPTKTNSNTSNCMKWTTPDIFLLSRQGTPLDHTLLQVCLLLGLNKVAFLACGTLLNRDPYSWAVTFHYEYIYNKNENDLDIELELNNRNIKGLFNKNMDNCDNNDDNSGLGNARNKKLNNNEITRGRNKSKDDLYGRNKMKSLSPKSIKGSSNYRNRSHDHLGSTIMDNDDGGVIIGNDNMSIKKGKKNVNMIKRSKELISSLSPVKIKNKIDNEKKNLKLRFYALFWDTVKHVVYRVDNIINECKNEEFMNWLKDQGYDMNQLEESAVESYYLQKNNDKKMCGNYNLGNTSLKNMNYKPNFCLKVVSKLPYRTIDMLVNNQNIYANIQQVHDPMKVSYNLSDNNLWFTFFHRDNIGNNNVNPKVFKNIDGNMGDKNGFIGDQLPITEGNSYILPCFTWPIINVITQQNYNNKGGVAQNKIGLGVKGVLSPIFNKKNKINNNQNKDKNVRIMVDCKGKDIENNSNSNNKINQLNEDDNEKYAINESELYLLGGYGDILDTEMDMYSRSINEEIVRYIQIQRFQKSRTIGTRWNNENDNMGFLRIGLKLLGKWEMSDPYTIEYYNNKNEFLKWRESFLSTVPKKYRLKYAILTFPYNIPRWLAQQVWFKCNFLSDETDRRSIFSLSVDVNSWPNNIKTIRVLILVIHPLKSSQLRKLKLIQKLNDMNINDISSSVIKMNENRLIKKYYQEKGNNIKVSDLNPNVFNTSSSLNKNKITNKDSDFKNNENSENDSLIYDDEKLVPPFPKDLLKDEINGSVPIEKRRSSSILFSDEEPELKLLHP
ncbi:hypothetical protein FG386_000123 [Cryptosporidium ryanae]|uniref:uncharacterized protein n=1 Tax=Cryptosporidium ryanae TaxID=515981 RepID=UPI00351A2EA8|nr:hypothetical protein FG386_000123 [Cryptosporidium ryanae]